ncbi:OpgC domain-containing protein [Tardiphaga sp. vice352]|uniref:OpgC domain-containing protein n=1 Tax=unclassified Tardiphaga TaxID=2631404 RepID=UPI001165769D|nr:MULTISPECIES: OpgC domain-containing protein [unclassified Tardiphaga]QDM17240.1 OpgC domain-containing protein [Tardiphaga sp. vice278]QDM22218.1 OpgC domain-containing protein [Tardiphaga sp. vice154]QDM32600.1 OpgC domain-containing protein [Tardiphaga sp. vice352]
MTIKATIPPERRDLRLDLFRGAANWAIFINHMPNNVAIWLTTRNYGFSDAAELFVFTAGYAATIVFSKLMITKGFALAAAQLLKRALQLYVAHAALLIFYITIVYLVAKTSGHLQLLQEYNVAGFYDDPVIRLTQGLLLNFKPRNLDILPLYVVLLAACPPVLWSVLRWPNFTISASFTLYLIARGCNWNLPGYPSGVWYFNPFTWQFLFFLGAWCTLRGARMLRCILHSKTTLIICLAYLIFGCMVTTASYSEFWRSYFPEWFLVAFSGNDKTNLDPHRILHFCIIAILVVRFIPFEWPGLRSRILRPLIVCGQHSLEVFCVGIVMSFIGYMLLVTTSRTLLTQMVITIAGIAALTGVGYYKQWSRLKGGPSTSRRSTVPRGSS